jgi:hypothetical protein
METEEVQEQDLGLSEEDKDFVPKLVERLVLIANEFMPEGDELRPYQTEFISRIFESLVNSDGATITGLFSRQSGKSESLSLIACVSMVFFPMLARVYPKHFNKYRNGCLIGAFAPVDEQADNLFGRIQDRISSKTARTILSDPDIDIDLVLRGRFIQLSNGSVVRKTTCHPKATIEGRTYHIILIDECQGAEKVVVDKKIAPMGAHTKATMIFTGTPDYTKSVFYDTIQRNKRYYASGAKKNHFEYDWRIVSKYDPFYKDYINKEIGRIGEDSNEFKLSYRLLWVLEKGMFTTSERLDQLGDKSMQSFVYAYHRTPIVVGIDVGRKQDRSIITAVYVDWNNPDPYGLYYHQVLNWLDLEGMDWEEQYFRITEFIENYNVWKIGIDVGGLGDVVAQRLKILLPHIEVIELGSTNTDQSERWKYLMQLMEHGQISWPDGAKVRTRKVWKRFRQEMEDLEVKFKGPYVLAEAPNVANAHDDYPDSLAMACILSKLSDLEGSGEVEISSNVLYSRHLNGPGAYTRSLR